MSVPRYLKSLTCMGWTLEAVLKHPAADKQRSCQVAELWCGVGSVWRTAAAEGYNAIGYDMARIPGMTDVEGLQCEDITTPLGFLNSILVVLSIVPGGLLWQGDRLFVHGVDEQKEYRPL